MAVGEKGSYLDPKNYFFVPALFESHSSVCGTYMSVYNCVKRIISCKEQKITVRYPLELWWWSSYSGNDDVRCIDLRKGKEMKFFFFFLPHAMKSFGEDASKLFEYILAQALDPSNLTANNLPSFDIFNERSLLSNVRERGEPFATYKSKVYKMVVKDDPVYVQEYKIGKKKCNGTICEEVPLLLNNFKENKWFYDSKF